MKKILLICMLIVALVAMTGCTSQHLAKQWGGEMTIELNKGEGLEMITWKDDNL